MSLCLLVVAKAPVAGLAKTRLTPPAAPAEAAGIAAAALLDTLAAVLATPGARPVVALSGDVRAGERAEEISAALAGCTVIPQRGNGFPARLANAHADVASRFPGARVLQIGMDTPQVTPALLRTCADRLDNADAAIGPATDGGWWALGLRDPAQAHVLRSIPTSRPDTGPRTRAALVAVGHRVADLPTLSDVDTMDDVATVAELAPLTHFATATSALRVRR